MVWSIKNPVVGIVVPNLNQGRFLKDALDSILSQHHVDIQIALMDAGSTDNSIELIKKYKKHFTYWRSHPDRGQAAAINEGIKRFKGVDYVGWLNADDILLDDGLKKMVHILMDDPTAVAVFGKGYIIDEKTNRISTYPTESFISQTFSHRCTICQPASLIKHFAWKKIGGLNEELDMCMDYDMWWRLSKIGQIKYLPEFVACSRDYCTTKTRTRKSENIDEAIQVVKRHYGYVPWNWFIAKSTMLINSFVSSESIFSFFINKLMSRFLACGLYLYYNLRGVGKGR